MNKSINDIFKSAVVSYKTLSPPLMGELFKALVKDPEKMDPLIQSNLNRCHASSHVILRELFVTYTENVYEKRRRPKSWRNLNFRQSPHTTSMILRVKKWIS